MRIVQDPPDLQFTELGSTPKNMALIQIHSPAFYAEMAESFMVG